MLLAVAVLYVWILFKTCCATQCLKNDDIGYRTGNIYYCTDPDASACCEMRGQFTCCEPGHVKHLREQLQLWGSISVFVGILVVVYIYLRKDVQVFSSPTIAESIRLIHGGDNSMQTERLQVVAK